METTVNNIARAFTTNPVGWALIMGMFVCGLISIFLRVRSVQKNTFDRRVTKLTLVYFGLLLAYGLLTSNRVISYDIFSFKVIGFVTVFHGLIDGAQNAYMAATTRFKTLVSSYIEMLLFDIGFIVAGLWVIFYL